MAGNYNKKEKQETKNRLGVAGEYRVLSELLLAGANASLTMGNAKGTDILIFQKDKTYLRLEVKTSKNGYNFVTSFFPKYTKGNESSTDPDFWVLFQPIGLKKNLNEEFFFILSHEEVRKLQLYVNKGNETKKGEGVDNIPLKILMDVDLVKQQLGDVEIVNNWRRLIVG